MREVSFGSRQLVDNFNSGQVSTGVSTLVYFEPKTVYSTCLLAYESRQHGGYICNPMSTQVSPFGFDHIYASREIPADVVSIYRISLESLMTVSLKQKVRVKHDC